MLKTNRCLIIECRVLYLNNTHDYCNLQGFVAIEPVNQPGSFIRHQNYRLQAHQETDDELYKNDASFLILGDVPGICSNYNLDKLCHTDWF